MAKLLLLLGIVGVVVWLFAMRRRGTDKADPPAVNKAAPKSNVNDQDAAPAPMIVCVHCGVHLPKADAQADAAGRLFCSEAHRLAGPR